MIVLDRAQMNPIFIKKAFDSLLMNTDRLMGVDYFTYTKGGVCVHLARTPYGFLRTNSLARRALLSSSLKFFLAADMLVRKP